MNLLTQVSRNIGVRKLFPDRQPILLAVSGGVDSMVLLELLAKLGKTHQWVLTLAHLNHCLRGVESDDDQRLVDTTAKRLGLKFVTEKCEVSVIARREKISLEMAARQSRHEFLARTAKTLRIPTVALAHHADDQVELFFLRLFRGGSVANLAGMHWRSRSPNDPKIFLVRPLLNLSKSALLDYAKKAGIDYREDKSNSSPDILRNRIRTILLPLLRKEYQPGIDVVVARAMEIMRAENECMEALTERGLRKLSKQWQGKTAVDFQGLPIALQRRCLLAQLDRIGVKPDFEMIEFLRLNPAKSLTIESVPYGNGESHRIKLEANGSIQMTRHKPTEFQPLKETMPLTEQGGTKTFGGIEVSWQFKDFSKREIPAQRANEEWFDADKVGSRLILRFWRPGDRFRPIGMKFDQKVQDLFTNQKIPAEKRRDFVMAEAERGRILWIEGQRISERFKLTKSTNRLLIWRWRRI